MIRRCANCGVETNGKNHIHHIIPKALGGQDTDGRDILCDRCHKDFHKRHYGVMLKLIARFGFADVARKRTRSYYEWWLKNG